MNDFNSAVSFIFSLLVQFWNIIIQNWVCCIFLILGIISTYLFTNELREDPK